MSVRPTTSAATWRPARALLHPLWLASLATLAFNDHVLKGAAILPGAVTGKLSDFAGLIVAPALLAAVLGLRSRRSWVVAHLAVGVVFTAIQLSATAASLWGAAMETIAFPWAITRDPTDLMALPALLVSAWVLRSAIESDTKQVARRGAEWTAATAGLVCCAATSPPPEPFEPFRPDLWTDVYLHNGSDEDLVVRMRPISQQTQLDCDVIAEDPGRLLTEPLFGNSQSVRLEPDQNFGLGAAGNDWGNEWGTGDGGIDDGEPVDGCYGYLLDIDGMPPAIVLWEMGSLVEQSVPGVGIDSGTLSGGIDILPSDDPDLLGTYEELNDDGILFAVPPATPPVDGACAPQDDALRLDWSDPVSTGDWHIAAIERGPDGCFALDLGSPDNDGVIEVRDRWYLCAPLADLGLEAGRQVRISNLNGSAPGSGGVTIATTDHAPGLPLVELRAFRGNLFPEFHGVSVAAVPDFECGYVVSDDCGTVTRGTAITAGSNDFGTTQVLPGENSTLQSDGRTMTIAVAHSDERAAFDASCAEGPDALGLDLEVAALYIESIPG